MRFMSPAPNQKRTAIHAESTLVNTARGPEQIQSREPYIARFRQGGATPAEVKLALKHFQFKGLGEREDPARRISIFDTDEVARSEGWSDEFKAEVEAGLLSGVGQFYIKIESPRVEIPWPSYDAANAKDVLATATTIGVDLEHVLAYERENQNRPEVISALEGVEAVGEVEVSA